MKKFLLIVLFFLFPLSAFASGNYSKDAACKIKDGIYKKNLQVNYPWAVTTVINFMKTDNSLYYIVNAVENNNPYIVKQWFYSYDCKKKKSNALISDLMYSDSSQSEAEIDYFNKDYIFIQYKTEYIDGVKSPSKELVYSRWNKTMNEFSFSNQDMLISQYVQDFWIINDTPFSIIDITSWKDNNLLVWITWGNKEWSMLRALSVNPRKLYASNVLYDYTLKKDDGSNWWLKMQWGFLYEKDNAGSWSKVIDIDTSTFRAIQANYGRDKNGYTLYNASKNLPKDAISEGYHTWHSESQWKIYSYNLWDWTSVVIKDPTTIFFHNYIWFNDPNGQCVDTTGSYGYVAEDSKFCYGNIWWSNASFGIVGTMK